MTDSPKRKEQDKKYPVSTFEGELLHQTHAAWPTWTGRTVPSPDRLRFQVINGTLVECKVFP